MLLFLTNCANFIESLTLPPIPYSIELLLICYFSQTFTEIQQQQLDDWMCANEANQRIFEECLEVILLPKQFFIDGQEFDFEIMGAGHLN